MPHSSPTLPQRLRRRKSAWVLFLLALIIKVVAGTACVFDGPGPVYASSAGFAMHTDAPAATDGEACVLGEAGGCHCACAHAVAMPVSLYALTAIVSSPDRVDHVPEPPRPTLDRSPLRPPIA
jgi:hypothetical protein